LVSGHDRDTVHVKPLTVDPGFFVSGFVFWGLNVVFPVSDMDQIDTVDVYGTFTESEAGRNQIESLEEGPSSKGNIGFGKVGKGV
jgi:hypothetical protein